MTILLIVAVVGVLLLIIALAIVVVLALSFTKASGPDAESLRRTALEDLGYAARGEGWIRPIKGTQMVMECSPAGTTWTLQLPRYNTLSLTVGEGGTSVAEAPFEAGQSQLDARFVFGSEQPARAMPLLQDAKVQRAMLRMPALKLSLSADELGIADPGNHGRATLNGTPLETELGMDRLVSNLVNAVFGALYTEAGTVFEQYR